MPTECSAKPMGFARVDGRAVVADFEGGAITSNAGGLLLGATDRAIGLVERFAACFADSRTPERVVHEVTTLVGQRVFGIALGYEDLVDHDRLRHDPVLGVALGRLEARHGRCAPLAGKSTLNRLEHGAAEADRYRTAIDPSNRRRSDTLCWHRVDLLRGPKSLSQKHFPMFNTPMHLSLVRYADYAADPHPPRPARNPTTNPDFDRAAAQRAAVPKHPTVLARRHDPHPQCPSRRSR